MKKTHVGIGVTVIGLIIFVVLLAMFIQRIPSGYVGVVYSTNGGVTGEIKGQGWHVMKPFEKLMPYPVSTETVYLTADNEGDSDNDKTLMVSTRDGKPVKMGIVYSYKMNAESTPDLFTKFRGRSNTEIQAGFMKDRLYKVVQEVVSKESVLDVYGDKRSDINLKVFEAYRDELSQYGIVIESFNFTEILPDEKTMQAIQATVDAQQEIKLLQVEKEKAKEEAERRKIEEDSYAEIRIIRAESQAQANRIVAESITDNLIKYNEVEKWDGIKPKVVGGNAITDLR